jgi:hypothetical protein
MNKKKAWKESSRRWNLNKKKKTYLNEMEATSQ